MQHYLNAMRRYFEFSGRSSRAEFWFFVLFVVLISILASIIDALLMAERMGGTGLLSSLVSLVHLIPGLAVSVRRLHDIDRTGWWVLLSLAPLGVLIVLGAGSMALMSGGSETAGMMGLAGMGATMVLVWLVNLAVLIVFLVFYCTAGTPGPNRFGPAPAS